MNDFPSLNSTFAPLPIQKSYLTPFPTADLIAKLEEYRKKGLTCTITIDTVVTDKNVMDETAFKLVQRLKELHEQERQIKAEQKALNTALEVAGVKPAGVLPGYAGHRETEYRNKGIFKGRSLPASCEIVLKEQKGQWLTKAEVEYLILQGGYEFTTGNPKNSIGVTLQRMAEGGLCEVERVRGKQGNRYRWPLPSEQVKQK